MACIVDSLNIAFFGSQAFSRMRFFHCYVPLLAGTQLVVRRLQECGGHAKIVVASDVQHRAKGRQRKEEENGPRLFVNHQQGDRRYLQASSGMWFPMENRLITSTQYVDAKALFDKLPNTPPQFCLENELGCKSTCLTVQWFVHWSFPYCTILTT